MKREEIFTICTSDILLSGVVGFFKLHFPHHPTRSIEDNSYLLQSQIWQYSQLETLLHQNQSPLVVCSLYVGLFVHLVILVACVEQLLQLFASPYNYVGNDDIGGGCIVGCYVLAGPFDVAAVAAVASWAGGHGGQWPDATASELYAHHYSPCNWHCCLCVHHCVVGQYTCSWSVFSVSMWGIWWLSFLVIWPQFGGE